jgi:hypothetical protein
MADNCKAPKNRTPIAHDRAVTEAPGLVAELCEDFDGIEGPFHLGPRTQAAIKELLRSYEFYKSRWDELSLHYPKFREPERTVVIEVIACGKSYAELAEESKP